MSCCNTLSGLERGCDKGIGGIRTAWIACWGEITGITVSGDKITGITPTTGVWHEYQFRKQTGSVTITPTVSDENGTIFYESAIVLQFSTWETLKRTEIAALGASDLAVIIEDNNGRYWYFGYDDYVTLTDGSYETGTAFGDFNGYNLTLTDFSKELPYEVSATVMEAIIAGED